MRKALFAWSLLVVLSSVVRSLEEGTGIHHQGHVEHHQGHAEHHKKHDMPRGDGHTKGPHAYPEPRQIEIHLVEKSNTLRNLFGSSEIFDASYIFSCITAGYMFIVRGTTSILGISIIPGFVILSVLASFMHGTPFPTIICVGFVVFHYLISEGGVIVSAIIGSGLVSAIGEAMMTFWTVPFPGGVFGQLGRRSDKNPLEVFS